MASEVVTHAPKAVIEELDNIKLGNLLLGEILTDIEYGDRTTAWYRPKTHEWFESFSFEERNEVQFAVAKHLMGEQRLQPEREPRWYVNSVDTDGEDVTYYLTDLRILDFCQSRENIKYECGMSKQLAEAIVAEVGGTIEEIK